MYACAYVVCIFVYMYIMYICIQMCIYGYVHKYIHVQDDSGAANKDSDPALDLTVGNLQCIQEHIWDSGGGPVRGKPLHDATSTHELSQENHKEAFLHLIQCVKGKVRSI